MGETICDFLIIGAGIIGLSIAREIYNRFPDSRIIILEKENAFAMHASGRNSGVLHAGFYYTEDSLKARFTRDGNRLLTEYCDQRGLKINKCGKLVVTRNDKDLDALEVLFERAEKNGVSVERLSAKEASKIEPRVKTLKYALWSPTTSTIDPKQVVESFGQELGRKGVAVNVNERYVRRAGEQVLTSKGIYRPTYLVNSAGLYADKIAKDYGFSKNYFMMPFKGIYLYANPTFGDLSVHVYPVPNLANPFLGVHFTRTVDGTIKIGPTAIPAFWREQYKGWDRFDIRELSQILFQLVALFQGTGKDFLRLAMDEIKKYYKPYLVREAAQLVTGVRLEDFGGWGEPGIRAQLVDRRTNRLEMDFVVEGDSKSIHVLNAVSPGFTCALSFSKYVVDQLVTFADNN
ncbi:MAG: L-2-hydroxyglutarate oxidase [Nitrospiraceae bacterium]|nr:L-2-hydroxyglutarate oxidase [Nitrospiraceae bacterium]